jgi:hypothetical protein
MSRVQPPVRLASFGSEPFGKKPPGCGQVRALAGMNAPMSKSVFVKGLENGAAVVASLQVAVS